MLELAIRSGEGPVQLETLAQVQRLPERYLAKIVQDLRRAGLIRSVRGARGGYMLARAPAAIEVLDIVRCLDGSVAPTECVDDPAVCVSAPKCVAREVWARVNDAIVDVLESVTLQDLVDRRVQKLGNQAAGALRNGRTK
jgi:Rrf2 family protein